MVRRVYFHIFEMIFRCCCCCHCHHHFKQNSQFEMRIIQLLALRKPKKNYLRHTIVSHCYNVYVCVCVSLLCKCTKKPTIFSLHIEMKFLSIVCVLFLLLLMYVCVCLKRHELLPLRKSKRTRKEKKWKLSNIEKF